MFCTFWSELDQSSPAGHAFLRGNGMPTGPGIEDLLEQRLRAPDVAAQKALAERLQVQALQDVPYVPLGQYLPATAYRRELSGIVHGVPVFWNLRRT